MLMTWARIGGLAGLKLKRLLQGGEGHRSLLPHLQGGGDDGAAGPDGGTYATSAGGSGLLDRAQPEVAGLCRRDGDLRPEEYVLY